MIHACALCCVKFFAIEKWGDKPCVNFLTHDTLPISCCMLKSTQKFFFSSSLLRRGRKPAIHCQQQKQEVERSEVKWSEERKKGLNAFTWQSNIFLFKCNVTMRVCVFVPFVCHISNADQLHTHIHIFESSNVVFFPLYLTRLDVTRLVLCIVCKHANNNTSVRFNRLFKFS